MASCGKLVTTRACMRGDCTCPKDPALPFNCPGPKPCSLPEGHTGDHSFVRPPAIDQLFELLRQTGLTPTLDGQPTTPEEVRRVALTSVIARLGVVPPSGADDGRRPEQTDEENP